jgi:hypothetical protein
MSMKNSNDTIRNRTLNLPACSAVFNQLRPRVPEEEEDRVLSMLSEWWGCVCVSAFNFIWTVFTKLYADHTPFRKFPHCFAWLDCDWNVLAHAQKPDFVFRAKRTSPFKSAGGRQFSRLLAAEVCGISGSDAWYNVFRGSVKGTGYPLHSPVSASLPLSCVTVCRHISTVLYFLRSVTATWRKRELMWHQFYWRPWGYV